jgi:hypothetical protein
MADHHFPWKNAFLNALRQRPVLRFACDVVGIDRTTAWRARQADPEFDAAVEEAIEDGIDNSEAEAFRRGTEGWFEPVIHKGQLAVVTEPVLDEDGCVQLDATGNVRMRPVHDASGKVVPLTVHKFSDALLVATLKARRKAYSTERTEHISPDGSMSPDPVARETRIAQIVAAAEARRKAAENAKPEDFA